MDKFLLFLCLEARAVYQYFLSAIEVMFFYFIQRTRKRMVEPKYMDDFDLERVDCQLAKSFVNKAQSCLSFQA